MRTYLLSIILLSSVSDLCSQCVPNYFMFRTNVECLGAQGLKINYTQEHFVAHDIFRRQVEDSAWGNPLVVNYWGNPINSGGSMIDNSFTAADHLPGQTYEYRFRRNIASGTYSGYIMAGCELAPVVDRGDVLVVYTVLVGDSLANELELMRRDLVGDGFKVHFLQVDETAPVTSVKESIRNIYNSMPFENKKYLYIVGHVPVPYSGVMMNDDIVAHRGAWPADVYYADMDGIWTDEVHNWTNSARPENYNVIGDGKFDQNHITSVPDLAMGRVDLSRLGCFVGMSEVNLLRRYFQKNRAFREGVTGILRNSYVNDLMPFICAENPQANGFVEYYGKIYGNNFPTINDTLWSTTGYVNNFLSGISSQSYLMSFIGGAGSYTNLDNIATAGQLNNLSGFNSVFNWCYGPYMADWDNTCNFLRMCIGARGTSLTQMSAANPSHYFHMFGLDRTIGECLVVNQWNSNRNYHNLSNPIADNYYRRPHIAMMGDPTLRMLYASQPINLQVSSIGSSARLDWSSASPNMTFLIFKAADYDQPFQFLEEVENGVLTYTDPNPLAENSVYMVRAKELQTTGSGSYYNLSKGVFAEFYSSFSLSIATTNDTICDNSSTLSLIYNYSSNLTDENAQLTVFHENPYQLIYGDTLLFADLTSLVIPVNNLVADTWIKVNIQSEANPNVSSRDSIYVVEIPNPTISINQIGSVFNFVALNVDNCHLEWILNNEIISNDSEINIESIGQGSIIQLVASNACGVVITNANLILSNDTKSAKDSSVLIVYPNPVNNTLTISNIPKNSKVELFDTSGKLVYENKNYSSNSKLNIDTADFSNGLYYIKVKGDVVIKPIKFVVQH